MPRVKQPSARELYEASVKDLSDKLTWTVEAFGRAVQALVNKYNWRLATGHMSDTWQVARPGKDNWRSEDDFPEGRAPKIFAELAALEEIGEDFRIGPSNMELYEPQRRKKKKQ